jgi:hypothetical protein
MNSERKFQYILLVIVLFLFPFRGIVFSQIENIAVHGTAYVWSQNTDEFSDDNKRAAAELNDENKYAFIWLNANEDGDMLVDIDSAWEAAGIIWNSPQTDINHVVFTNGPFDGGSMSDGAFTKNFHIQITRDGNTWENIDIEPVPSYVYNTNNDNEGEEVSDQDFVFTGDFDTVFGVRVLGQVRTDNGQWWGSYASTCRQVEVWMSMELPLIVRQPQSQIKKPGETAMFSLEAVSNDSLSYQWYRNSVIINGANDSAYVTEVLDEGDSGDRIYCDVSNIYGITTSDTALLVIYSPSEDSLVLAKDSLANFSIYYGLEEEPLIEQVVLELSKILEQISGAKFSITTDENFDGPKIIIGQKNPFTIDVSEQMNFDSITKDGFRIMVSGGNIYIAGSIDRGTVYGVYQFIDYYLGVRWFSSEFEVVPVKNTLVIDRYIDDLQNPCFSYREVFSGDSEDEKFRQHNKLNGSRGGTHREVFDTPSEMWSKDGPSGGHNFQDIISSNYHYGGQILTRSSAVHSQAVNYFKDLIGTKGNSPWYAFSQEDNGWDPDAASKSFANSHGGALSAPIVDMVTDIAQQVRQTYPEAHLSTNAYQWSFAPPTGLTVPDYVMVEMAPIEADFGYSYNDSIHNPETSLAFKGWGEIASSLGVWDYITNFQNYLQPYPNIYPLCQNIQYYATIDAIRSYFGEGGYNTEGAEFADLRAWVAARLLWNPELDYMKLVEEFCDGYYGPASTYIKQYIDLLHTSFQDKNERLGSKQRITADYLNLGFILQADQLMLEANAIATGDYSKHVHEVRLGVDMTILLREHMYEAEAQDSGIIWIPDPNRRTRFNQYVEEAGITDYSEDASIHRLMAVLNIDRVNPGVPDIVGEGDEWIDYQDLDMSICCGAILVEDTLASDHGAARLGNEEWAIQMKFDMLPPGEDWVIYAYVRVFPKSNGDPDGIAFNMGVWPGDNRSVKLSEVNDGKYHVFEFHGNPFSYETGKYLWFSTGHEVYYIYVDRVVAIRKTTAKNEIISNPFTFRLRQNYPNPFSQETSISYTLPQTSDVILSVYNMIGQKISTIVNKQQAVGNYQVSFNASQLPGGIYFYRMTARGVENYIKTMKMIIRK